MLDAEWRSLYDAGLTTIATRRKPWILFGILLLSSGAASAAVARQPAWIATSLSLAVAGLSAYSISANLDGAITTLQKLHLEWSRIQNEYERLWNHTYAEEAEAEFSRIQERGRAASALGATAPYQKKRVAKWVAWVDRLHTPIDSHVA